MLVQKKLVRLFGAAQPKLVSKTEDYTSYAPTISIKLGYVFLKGFNTPDYLDSLTVDGREKYF